MHVGPMTPETDELGPDQLGPDDSRVLSRLVEHRDAELSSLFIKVRDHLKGMVSARLDGRLVARVDSSDIVQEVYIRASRGLDTFLKSPNVHPYVWLRLICKQIVAETHERHYRAKRTPAREVSGQSDQDLLLDFLVLSSPSVQTQLARAELQQQIRDRIASLASLDREILEMRHTEGLSMIQISQLLEISLDTAKKRYYRAVERFRNLVGADSLDSWR